MGPRATRLRYGDIYNFPAANYNDVLDREQTLDLKAAQEESDAESEEERLVEFIEAAEESDSDLEDLEQRHEEQARPLEYSQPPPAAKRKPRRARVAIEYDDEDEEEAEPAAAMAF